jgi:hypothetical protein
VISVNFMKNSMNSRPRSWEKTFLPVCDEWLQSFQRQMSIELGQGELWWGCPGANIHSSREGCWQAWKFPPSVQSRAGADSGGQWLVTMAMIQEAD